MNKKTALRNMIAAAIMIGLIIPAVKADTLSVTDLTITPNIFWLQKSDTIEIKARCKYTNTTTTLYVDGAVMYAEIYAPGTSSPVTSPFLSYDTGSGFYRYSLPPIFSQTGFYTIKAVCNYLSMTASAQQDTPARRLSLSIIRDKNNIETYLGGQITIDVAFKLDGQIVTPTQDTFSVYLNDYRLNQPAPPIIVDGNKQRITVDIPESSRNIKEGTYDLELKAGAQGESVSQDITDYVKVNGPLKIKILNDAIVCPANKPCEAVLNVSVEYYAGTIGDLRADTNFESVIMGEYLPGKVVSIKQVTCNDLNKICQVTVLIPSTFNAGSYDLFLTVATPRLTAYDYKDQDSVTVTSVLHFSGTIMSAQGNPIQTTLTFNDKTTGDTIETNTDGIGNYNIDLLPSTYDVTLQFSTGAIVTFYNVNISNSDLTSGVSDVIHYDGRHTIQAPPDGIRLVELAVFEFGFPFQAAESEVKYDDMVVKGPESGLSVFMCDSWNFKTSSCSSEWTRVESEVNTIRNVVHFVFNQSATFLIGETLGLTIKNLDFTDKTYNIGDPIFLRGRVQNTDGNYIDGVSVTARFSGESDVYNVLTASGGRFEVQVNAPKREGQSELVLTASKSPYQETNYTTLLSINRKQELTVLGLPDIVPITFNKTNRVTFTLYNSGQVNFTDPVYINLQDFPSQLYQFSPPSLTRFSVDEKRDIIMEVTPTEDVCSGGICKDYMLVTLNVKSGEYENPHSFSFKLENINKNVVSNGTDEAALDEENVPGGTGFATSIKMPSVSVEAATYVFLLFVIVGLLALIITKPVHGGWKKGPPKSDFGGGRRPSFGGVIRPSSRSGFGEGNSDGLIGTRASVIKRIKRNIE
ncbi:Carboxypeptidase regulatory-like domain protein [uncultured archaeon]|nr:Carboxypeptidase regulatory-like domain protein [uncultured archaeon]